MMEARSLRFIHPFRIASHRIASSVIALRLELLYTRCLMCVWKWILAVLVLSFLFLCCFCAFVPSDEFIRGNGIVLHLFSFCRDIPPALAKERREKSRFRMIVRGGV